MFLEEDGVSHDGSTMAPAPHPDGEEEVKEEEVKPEAHPDEM